VDKKGEEMSIMYQAHRVLNALDEGMVQGMIYFMKYHSPDIDNRTMRERIAEVLLDCGRNQDMVDYWVDWFGLDKDEEDELEL